MPKLKNSNATFWVIFKHCAQWAYLVMATCPSFRRFPPEWLTGTACGYDKKTNTFKRFCPSFATSIDELTSDDDDRPFRGIFQLWHGIFVSTKDPWNCKTKACNCYWHAWGEPTIRHNSAIALHRINRILHRERDCKGPFGEPDIGSFQNRNDFQVLDLHHCYQNFYISVKESSGLDLTPWL